MSDKENTSLVPRPSGELVRIPPGASAIIDGMVNDATDIICTRDAIRHRIGGYEFRETDYQQLQIWAKATDLQPEEFLEGMNLIVSDGIIVSLEWHNLEVGVELDLSRVSQLEELFCEGNYLTALDLSQVPHLKILHCGRNRLTELVLSQVPHLKELDCSRNDLTELDLSRMPYLETLNCEGNDLTELDLSQVPRLKELDCEANYLAKLDLSRMPHLETLNCWGNDLTELDLSRVPYLKELCCAANHLAELDLSRVPHLEELSCQEGNTLTELDISDLKTAEPIVECDSDVRIHKRDDQHPVIYRTISRT